MSFVKNERGGQRHHVYKLLWLYIKTQTSIMGSLDPNKILRRKTWIPLMIVCYKGHNVHLKGNPHYFPLMFLTP
jgi:hypothetical protein